jgi:hypothetical protein
MLIVPVWIAIGVAGIVTGQVLLFALTTFGFFVLRYPLMLLVKSRAPQARAQALRWTAIYGALTLLAGLVLMLVSRLWLLIPLAALGFVSLVVYLWQAANRAEMSTLGEWTGIAGLALGAPGAYLVATGSLDATAVILYLLNLLYFGGTVFYIKFKVREQPRIARSLTAWRARLWAGRVTLFYHAMVILVVASLAALGWLPWLAPFAFVPMICKAVRGVLTLPVRLNIRRLGFIELGLTIGFGLGLLFAYRLS